MGIDRLHKMDVPKDIEAKSNSRMVAMFQQLKWQNLVAGVSGGVLATFILHPLDLIKIRLQVSDGQASRPSYGGLSDVYKSVVKQSGHAGLYAGVGNNMVCAGTLWGSYFLLYNAGKSYLQDGDTNPLGPGSHMLAAAQAGALSQLIANPLFVARTRLCLQYEGAVEVDVASSQIKVTRYNGIWDVFRKVYKYEGIKGLYQGTLPGMSGIAIHSALQFMAYEELKRRYYTQMNIEHGASLGVFTYITLAGISKMFAAVITYPYLTVRVRLQDAHGSYSGVIDTAVKTYRRESIRGFYKGLMTHLLRVTPGNCITFLVYEKLTHYLMHKGNNG